MLKRLEIIAGLVLFVLTGCRFNPLFHGEYRIVNSAPGPRVYLFSGFPGDKTQWSQEPQISLSNSLDAAGYQVVLLAVPVAMPELFVSYGKVYRLEFESYVRSTIEKIDAEYGHRKSFVGGISYGGLHAIMASHMFDGWFAHLPVVRLDALTEMRCIGDVSSFNPQFETITGRGRLSCGSSDTRVNGSLTKSLKVGADVDRVEYPGLDHETKPEAISDIIVWLKSH